MRLPLIATAVATILGSALLGCASSGGFKRFDDPTLDVLRTRFLSEKDAFEAGQAALFDQAQPGIPCAFTNDQIRELSGMPAEDTIEKTNRGLAPHRLHLSWHSPKVVLLDGSCRNGRLDGPVRYLGSVTMTRFRGEMLVLDHETATVREGEMRNGRFVGDVVLKQRDRQSLYEVDSKIVTDWLVLGYERFDGAGNPIGTDVQFTFQPQNGPHKFTQTTRHGADGRAERVRWSGDRLAARASMKNGRQHGEEVIFSRRSGFTTIAEQRSCWRDGEQILTPRCDVR